MGSSFQPSHCGVLRRVLTRPRLYKSIRLIVLLSIISLEPQFRADDVAVNLPDGVKAVWDVAKAYHETTPTRERICLNGLWRWQPAGASSDQAPAGSWGYFKVPGCWSGITDYLQKDSQTLYAHPNWKQVKLGGITSAWYEREVSVPVSWSGRRISLHIEYLNSYAMVFVNGVKTGEIHFPGGELDLTAACRPSAAHRLSLLVAALPLKGVLLSYTDSASAREVKGTVERRGLCGDVFLAGTPRGPKITDVSVDTSLRKRALTVNATVGDAESNERYNFRVRIMKEGAVVKEFTSPSFQGSDLRDGRFAFTETWLPDELWDINTPQNTFDLQVSLLDGGGQVLDTDWAQRLGFREFWIDGRDFYLNGTRIFLSAVPLDNAQVGAALATYDAARESLARLKSFGINYVYTHNYGCEPGSHLSFTEVLRAADDVGMLVGFTQPHFSHYEWKTSDADQDHGYARHATFYARAAGNHPSVVMYVMSHNATGYEEDMNPDMIDGIHDGRDSWGSKNVKLAERAEAIVKKLDPRRIVYHHASGNLGVMHDSNFYPNFAPIQELDDWFEHWATEGIKPAFTCEYGAPFTWDWTMYRGWFKGQREWGSARVPWEFCLAEWNAQFFGDRAYQISEAEKANLRWEAGQFRAGNVWHRWDYPNPVGSDRFDECYPVFAMYLTSNWRAYRTWGVSGISPWEYGHYWKLRAGVDKSRKQLKVDWENLQRPGFSPDYIDQRYERMDIAFESSDWVATPAAQALIRNNRPLLAYLAGAKGAFTSKDHNFLPGETVEKQVMVINNSRETVTCEAEWSLDLPQSVTGKLQVMMATGEQARIPLRFELPQTIAAGSYEIRLKAKFGNGETQEDRFFINVLPPIEPTKVMRALTPSLSPSGRAGARVESAEDLRRSPLPKIALFDPIGESTKVLRAIGVRADPISANADLSTYAVVIIGKAALTLGGPAPDVGRVRDGLKVIVFEQTSDVLEKRLGFRVEEHGLRRVFPRVPDHPLLNGVNPENLHDWRGSATILPPRLKYEMRPRYGPTVQWAGIPVTRVWRCGNRGNVASVLIEKPARGDFLPVLDGGFSLQYSPLMEYREGKGMVLFCQLDVTGRSESDPAAETLSRNILKYVSEWKPVPRRQAVYAGEPAGRTYLSSMGVPVRPWDGAQPSNDEVLVLGPGAGQALAKDAAVLADFLKSGGNLLAIGLNQEDSAALPFKVTMRKAEHIASFFEPPGLSSLLAGVGPADVHNRDPRELSLVSSGAEVVGDGVLAKAEAANVVFIQMPPWQFEGSQTSNLRRTFRRISALLDRLLANMGVTGVTPLIERFQEPVSNVELTDRWKSGFYLDQVEEWDDPYRFFRW